MSQVVPLQPHLFELPAFKPRGFAVAFTSANNIAVSEVEAEVLQRAEMLDPEANETLLAFKVFVTVKGHRTDYGKIVYSLVVGDCTLDD